MVWHQVQMRRTGRRTFEPRSIIRHAPMTLPPGTRIGPYEILSALGAGGMGEVYLAEDTRLHRRVALKLLQAGTEDESSRKRLLREARAAATLDHPNICAVFDVGDADGRGYIAMQYVEGETLASRLEREPLALPDAVSIAAQVVAALDEAHRRGVIHRDVKPQNIILSPQNRVKVLDFGLAQLTPLNTGEFGTTTLAVSTGISGTVPYMSPEQLRGETLDSRSDIFSFGVVLYQLVARVHPFFGGGHGGTIAAILTQEPPALGPGVPGEMQRIVRKCLEKDRERRYQSMRDCLIDLESFARDLTSPSKIPSSRYSGRILEAATTLQYAATAHGARRRRASAGRGRQLALLPIQRASAACAGCRFRSTHELPGRGRFSQPVAGRPAGDVHKGRRLVPQPGPDLRQGPAGRRGPSAHERSAREVRTGIHAGWHAHHLHHGRPAGLGYVERPGSRRRTDPPPAQRVGADLARQPARPLFGDRAGRPPHGSGHRHAGPRRLQADLLPAARAGHGAFLVRFAGSEVDPHRRDGPHR